MGGTSPSISNMFNTSINTTFQLIPLKPHIDPRRHYLTQGFNLTVWLNQSQSVSPSQQTVDVITT